MNRRRVVRTDTDSSKNIVIEKTIHISVGTIIGTLCKWLWCLVKVLWYWFERIVLVMLLVGLTIGLAWWLSQKPSLYRDWNESDAVLPSITWSGDTVTVDHVRDFIWSSPTAFSVNYRTISFDLDQIQSMDYVITPFSENDGPAHTMFTFTFSGGQSIAISPEVRKERGETFDAVKGVMNQYELQYVVATETDVIKLRTNYRKNEVYMYPIRADKEDIKAIFRSMIVRADTLSKEPEFYNTLWNNCATSILNHTNSLRTNKLKAGIYTLLPAHSDQMIYDAGLMDTKLSLPEARSYYRIDQIAQSATGSTDFSTLIHRPIQ